MVTVINYRYDNGNGILTLLDYEKENIYFLDAIGMVRLLQSSGNDEFTNIALVEGQLIFTNGKADNYMEDRLTIINRINCCGCLVGYTLSNRHGAYRTLRRYPAIQLAEKYGLTNGCIVEKGDIKILRALGDKLDVIEQRDVIYSQIDLLEMKNGLYDNIVM